MYRIRCGKSEEIHSVMKEDLAGGKLPSGNFMIPTKNGCRTLYGTLG